MWNKILHEATGAILDVIFPPLCLHCECSVLQERLFCTACSDLLSLVDPSERCSICFAPLEDVPRPCCPKQAKVRSAHCCEHFGPVQTLIENRASSVHKAALELMGSFFTVQICRLAWELPKYIFTTCQYTSEIAQHMQAHLTFTAASLKIKKYTLSKDGLTGSISCYWNRSLNISDEDILIISLYRLRSVEQSKIIEELSKGAPKKLSFLSFTEGVLSS